MCFILEFVKNKACKNDAFSRNNTATTIPADSNQHELPLHPTSPSIMLKRSKKKNSRQPRTIFTTRQLYELEESFHKNHYPNIFVRQMIAARLHLTASHLQVKFPSKLTHTISTHSFHQNMLNFAGNFWFDPSINVCEHFYNKHLILHSDNSQPVMHKPSCIIILINCVLTSIVGLLRIEN